MRPNRVTALAKARYEGWIDGALGVPQRGDYVAAPAALETAAQMDAALERGNWYLMGYFDGRRDREKQALLSDLLTENLSWT